MRLRKTTPRLAATILASLLIAVPAQPQGRGPSGGAGRGQAQDNLVSPEVHPDRTVTFRVRVPEAKVVTLTGDWLATLQSSTGGTIPMTKDSSGIWSVTSAPLEATVHLYSFTIDGLNIADPINPRMKLRVRTSASLVEVPADPVPVWGFRDNIPHGSMDWNQQHSAVYNDTHEFLVYLPPDYHTGKAKYPVLYLVHGAGDTALGWGTAGAANLILDSLIAEKKAVPMIVVMPFNGSNNPQPAGGRGNGGNAGAAPAAAGGRGANGGSGRGGRGGGNTQFEDYMVKELIPFIDSHYRVASGRQNRAMAGLSAGGGATFNVAFKHTELFSAAGLFSAATTGSFEARYPELAADAKGTNAKMPVIWIGCGTSDTLDVPAKTLDAELTKLKINHTYKDRDGGHVWPVWRWALSEFVPLIFHKS
jgi:enterochelin esterase family protein